MSATFKQLQSYSFELQLKNVTFEVQLTLIQCLLKPSILKFSYCVMYKVGFIALDNFKKQ